MVISRYAKIPIYLNWANIEYNVDTIEDYPKSFSELVTQAVIESLEFLVYLIYWNQIIKQRHFLFTATPQEEIEFILENLGIGKFFKDNSYPTKNLLLLKI